MKKSNAFIISLVLIAAMGGTAQAHRKDGLEGLLIGGASGAIIGQAIARDVEGVIVGSIIGGTLGLIIDRDLDHAWVGRVPVPVFRTRVVQRTRPEVTVVKIDRRGDGHDWYERRNRRYDHRRRHDRR